MKLTIKCEHGVQTTVEDAAEYPAPHYLRLFIRNVLLACPACRRQAEAEIEDVGE